MHPLPAPNREASSQNMEARDQSGSTSQHPLLTTQPSNASQPPGNENKKRRKHRGGKKRRNRRQSFAAPSETSTMPETTPADPMIDFTEQSRTPNPTFYRRRTGNLSTESLDSDALLDHRTQPSSMRPRRGSTTLNQMHYASTPFRTGSHGPTLPRQDTSGSKRSKHQRASHDSDDEGSDPGEDPTDRTPLLTGSAMHKSPQDNGYGLFKKNSRPSSVASSRRHNKGRGSGHHTDAHQEYDVNNPPSHPGSPELSAQFDDVMVGDNHFMTRSPENRKNVLGGSRDALIDIDVDQANGESHSAPPSPRMRPDGLEKLRQPGSRPEIDVCFPTEAMSEMGEEDYERTPLQSQRGSRRRNRRREWPQLWVLEQWSAEEKEERAAGERRAKKVNEPLFLEGRLRAPKTTWHRTEEDVPYRYTYFNEEFESTIHAQTISELVAPGGSFRDLFIPDPPELSDSSEEEEDWMEPRHHPYSHEHSRGHTPRPSDLGNGSRLNSMLSEAARERSREASGGETTEEPTPSGPMSRSQTRVEKPKKYGPRPTWWLDVLCPTDQEMRVICKTFGIHALTSEDIMMQEAREKVELFRNYYFINYRTFEQDQNSEDHLEPINMYVCVFREGIISFHFSQIPHPANVRRRIRQLSDYLILSADWISYAIIDDITDVYQPLITDIETEVDDIDDLILRALQDTNELKSAPTTGVKSENKSDINNPENEKATSGIDMLRRIGECRKKVMSLYRLLGNKADVIKGFAKRCNEQWEVAPKSEIGLYLGDIQDHILTMTSNLGHYETLLSRAHSNYLAQVSIRMNERQEETADVLGKLTVVGTIVLPMNIICGMWGMNVKVPGQEIDSLTWFWSITAGLILFGILCYYWCKRVYGIV